MGMRRTAMSGSFSRRSALRLALGLLLVIILVAAAAAGVEAKPATNAKHKAAAAPKPKSPPKVRRVEGVVPRGAKPAANYPKDFPAKSVAATSKPVNKTTTTTTSSATSTTGPPNVATNLIITIGIGRFNCPSSWSRQGVTISLSVKQILPDGVRYFYPESQFTYTITARSIKYFGIELPSYSPCARVTRYTGPWGRSVAKAYNYRGRNYFLWLDGWYSNTYQTKTFTVNFRGIPTVQNRYLLVASYHANGGQAIGGSVCGLRCSLGG
eukprot:jgi/Chlat1/1901/Chrsp147S02214